MARNIPQLDPWGGLGSAIQMMNALSVMEDREDKKQAARVKGLWDVVKEIKAKKVARVKGLVSTLQSAWTSEESVATRKILQAQARMVISENPDSAVDLMNIAGGMVDENLEKAENYVKYNQVRDIDPSITWESDFLAKAQYEFKKRHLMDRAGWIAGGEKGPLTLTKMMGMGVNKETGKRIYAAFDNSSGMPLYSQMDTGSMLFQTQKKKFGITNVGADGIATIKTGKMQFAGRIYDVEDRRQLLGPNAGQTERVVRGLPADLRADQELKVGVMKLLGDETPMDKLPKKDWPAREYLNQLQNYYKHRNATADKDVVKKMRAEGYMRQALPNVTAVLLDPGHEEKLFEFSGENDWTTGETERLKWVPGRRISLIDKKNNWWGYIYNELSDTIRDSKGNPVKIDGPDGSGNLITRTFHTKADLETWLKGVDLKAIKAGKEKVALPPVEKPEPTQPIENIIAELMTSDGDPDRMSFWKRAGAELRITDEMLTGFFQMRQQGVEALADYMEKYSNWVKRTEGGHSILGTIWGRFNKERFKAAMRLKTQMRNEGQ